MQILKGDENDLMNVDAIIIVIKDRYDLRDLIAVGDLPPMIPKDLRYVGLNLYGIYSPKLCFVKDKSVIIEHIYS